MTLLALLIACGPGLSSRIVNGGGEDAPDTTPPVIDHAGVGEVITFGTDVSVLAEISDPESRIVLVTLWFKNETDGTSDWQQRAMVLAPDVEAGEDSGLEVYTYTATIPGAQHRSGGMDYYIEAVNNAQLTARAPDEGASDPFHFRLTQ